MTKTLEELLAAGEVESAVIIKDPLLNQFINEQQAEIERLREALQKVVAIANDDKGRLGRGYHMAAIACEALAVSGETPE